MHALLELFVFSLRLASWNTWLKLCFTQICGINFASVQLVPLWLHHQALSTRSVWMYSFAGIFCLPSSCAWKWYPTNKSYLLKGWNIIFSPLCLLFVNTWPLRFHLSSHVNWIIAQLFAFLSLKNENIWQLKENEIKRKWRITSVNILTNQFRLQNLNSKMCQWFFLYVFDSNIHLLFIYPSIQSMNHRQNQSL